MEEGRNERDGRWWLLQLLVDVMLVLHASTTVCSTSAIKCEHIGGKFVVVVVDGCRFVCPHVATSEQCETRQIPACNLENYWINLPRYFASHILQRIEEKNRVVSEPYIWQLIKVAQVLCGQRSGRETGGKERLSNLRINKTWLTCLPTESRDCEGVRSTRMIGRSEFIRLKYFSLQRAKIVKYE